MKRLFSDRSKSKATKDDPTLTRLKAVQNYMNIMLKRKETLSKKKINYQQMAVQLEHESGLAKTHKAYANLTSL